VTEDWVCKVGDMGFSHTLPERAAKFSVNDHGDQGSVLYQAPEMLRIKFLGGNKDTPVMNSKLDVWAFGLMLWEIFTQTIIFNDAYTDAVVYATDICNHKVRPDKSPLVPEVILPIIDSCLQENPSTRPTFAELKERLEDARVRHFLGTVDHDAEAFWKTHWPTKGKVDWFNNDSNCFIRVLCRHFGWSQDSQIYKLDPTLVPLHSGGFETLENFQNLMYWFGPFTVANANANAGATTASTATSSTSKAAKGTPFLANLEEICSQPWFWGSVPNDTALAALNAHEVETGTFVVRLNLGKNQKVADCPYTILFVDKNKTVQTLRVWFRPEKKGLRVVDQGLHIDVKTGSLSIVALVNELRAAKVIDKAQTSAIFNILNGRVSYSYLGEEKPKE